MSKSVDGGKTFTQMDNAGGFFNMMEDHHAFFIDRTNSKHLLSGSDAGLAVSWDQGKTWEYMRTMATAQAYWVSADMGHPYNVYAGFQDNDSWGGPSVRRSRIGINASDWFHLGGGDGLQTAADPTNLNIVYVESQDGNVNRFDLSTGRSTGIRPVAPPVPGAGGGGQGGRGGRGQAGGGAEEAAPAPPAAAPACVDGRVGGAGGRGAGAGGAAGGAAGAGGGRGGAQPNVQNAQPGDAYRFNWNTPILLSPHDARIVWLGGNRLFKSYNQGESWTASADLTRHVDRCGVSVMNAAGSVAQLSKNDGVGSFSTIVSVGESPVAPGVVWAGTDDGNLQVSRDGGVTFTEVGQNIRGLPASALSGSNPYWFSRVEASHFDAGTAYVAVDGHRADDLTPYVFKTTDYGRTWSSIAQSLPPSGNVQTVREDPKNRALLFVGTDFGLFLSLDGGVSWEKFMNNLPTVRTDEVQVHPRESDLIVATHGRSIWIADDISPLQQLTPEVRAQDVWLFEPRAAVAWLFDLRSDHDVGGDHRFEGENPARGTAISYYLSAAATGEVKVKVTDLAGRTLCESKGPSTAGIHRVQWALVAPMLAGTGRGGAGAAPDVSCSGAAGGRGGGAGGGGGANAVAPGSYVATLTVGGREFTRTIRVLEDIWLRER